MKNTIIAILSVFALLSANTFCASAQTNSYEAKRVTSYIKASVTLNDFSFDNSTPKMFQIGDAAAVSSGPTVGYNAVVGFQYRFVPGLGFYLGMDAGFGSRGMGVKLSLSPDLADVPVSVKGKVFTHCVKASPLQLGYQFNISDIFSIDVRIGGYVSYDFAGKFSVNAAVAGVSNTESRDISEYKEFNRFDAGINPGVGLWFGPVGVDFTYQRGFVNINNEKYDSSAGKMYSQNFLLGVAYRF